MKTFLFCATFPCTCAACLNADARSRHPACPAPHLALASPFCLRAWHRRMAPKILMVLSSHAELGNTGKKTGFWLEEFAAPFYVFKDAGAEITLASPKGGAPPLDPASEGEQFQTDATRRYKDDQDAAALLAATVKLETCNPATFDAVFYPGGHGPMWDLAEDPTSIKLIEGFWASGKTVSAVCHGVAALRHCKTKCPYGGEDMKYIVDNKRMTGFTNSEEQAVGLSNVVPFSLEDELKGKGADFSAGEDWAPRVCVHGKLITGQNPASSEQTASEVLRLLSGESLLLPLSPFTFVVLLPERASIVAIGDDARLLPERVVCLLLPRSRVLEVIDIGCQC